MSSSNFQQVGTGLATVLSTLAATPALLTFFSRELFSKNQRLAKSIDSDLKLLVEIRAAGSSQTYIDLENQVLGKIERDVKKYSTKKRPFNGAAVTWAVLLSAAPEWYAIYYFVRGRVLQGAVFLVIALGVAVSTLHFQTKEDI